MAKKPLVSLITCTGYRDDAFRLCKEYYKRQTYKGPMEWVIINDGDDLITKVTEEFDSAKVFKGPYKWRSGVNTQRPNMNEALKRVKGDYILIFEDDDWYDPIYVEKMVDMLDRYPIVGEGNAKYYNVLYRSWKEHRNIKHASLCQTGIRREYLELLDQAVNSGELYFDVVLWRLAYEKGIDPFLFLGKDYCVGIKGLPGRFGIGVGHKPKDFLPDPDFSMLKKLVKDDFEEYKKIAESKYLYKDTAL